MIAGLFSISSEFILITTNFSFFTSAFATILLTLFMILMLIFIFHKIERLNQEVKIINSSNSFFKHVSSEGNDEITSLASQINQMVDDFQATYDELKKSMAEKSGELQSKNIQLQQEINASKKPKKMLMSHEYLTQLARYDTLTALPNRMFFNEILNKSINHAKRRKKILAILYVSIDNFHFIKDQTLSNYISKEIGYRLSNLLRAEDILAKLDNEDFIILLNDIGKPKFASTVAQKLLRSFLNPIKFQTQEMTLTASIGICIYPSDATSLEGLLKDLDIVVQKVKNSGGNNYQFYSQSMDIEAREYIQLEGALRQALPNNELTLYFQPKIHLKHGSIVGVEALIRWTHPELGVISPAKFIPLAEETGLIMEIGEWSLLEACKINKHWQEEGYEHISVAVNLSPKQFYHPSIADSISQALQSSGLNPSYLEIEINEETVMTDMDAATKKLDSIQMLGVCISLDHFGTGYTSISHLKQFHISSLKIDQSFIKGIPLKPDDLAITSAMIALAHNLGLTVVAEGVETVEQVQHLAAQGCDIVQGYFLSHPLPQSKIVSQFNKLREGALM